MTEPKPHITNLRNRQAESDESLLAALAGAINRLEKAFPEQWHFLMEFIQNADDSQSTTFSLRISEDKITVLNDGKPFDKADVESICNVGQSSKAHPDRGEEYIGYLGVGFKSVFLISENPQIYSGEYQFKFDKSAWEEPNAVPWQITPLWIDEATDQIPEGFTTKFEIPLSEDITEETFDKLTEELKAEQISDRTILFLKNLQKIEIIDEINETQKTIEKRGHQTGESYDIIDVRVENEIENQSNKWLVFNSVAEVPSSVKGDPMTKRWERDGLQTREVMVAFKLDSDETLVQEQGTAHIGVFSFLPLKEVPSGLDFLVQADFLTAPGRETIHRDAPWNRWLAAEVFDLLTETVIPTFKQDTEWRQNFTELLYPQSGGHSLFNQEIHEPLQNHLKSQPVILTLDEQFARPNECVVIDSQVQDLISDADFQQLYPDHKRIHDECTVARQLERQMVSGPSYSSTKGLKNGMAELLKLKSSKEDIEFFETLYREFGKWSTSTLSGTKMQREPIVITSDGSLCTPREASLRTNVEIPPQVADEFTFVHPEISDEDALSVLKTLGVDEISQADIDDRVDIEQTLNLKKWNQLSDTERIAKTRNALRFHFERGISVADLSKIEFLTTDDEWRDSSDIVFSNAYNPEHNLEALNREGLVPTNISFLSPRYLSDSEEYTAREWREFLEAVGVEEELNESSLVEQIGIESALRIEEEQGRDAAALPRHEEKEGYDIESDDRFVEVKGSKKSSPSVNLTQQQFSRLKDDQEKYYLYIVRNALERPEVTVIQGENILDVSRSIRVSYSELRGLSESEHTVV